MEEAGKDLPHSVFGEVRYDGISIERNPQAAPNVWVADHSSEIRDPVGANSCDIRNKFRIVCEPSGHCVRKESGFFGRS
ncbi:hypothetical protein GCM10010365_03120 [Streptomyces poonensis]|uniref:Uncharacterized protein n=1 Tax=Streptomyces poonensis TaxID=68255 RepID=A0A918P7V8_9ACTN|nr:hypothetical protein GCM10010365_03120 [Streptomyces poonensis]GLJ92371.1 hypothetical protein GCM10017589_49800 [Streptomyces poonensis]